MRLRLRPKLTRPCSPPAVDPRRAPHFFVGPGEARLRGMRDTDGFRQGERGAATRGNRLMVNGGRDDNDACVGSPIDGDGGC